MNKKIKNYDKKEIKHIHLTSIIPDYIVNDKKTIINIGYIYEYCPFCTHKNHFQINIKENLYSSFSGCCKGGDIINFVMEIEGLNFKEAIEHLGDRFKVNKTTINSEYRSKREKEILHLISLFEIDRLEKEKNTFFDFLKFMGYNDIFFNALAKNENELIQYIYYCKNIGIY